MPTSSIIYYFDDDYLILGLELNNSRLESHFLQKQRPKTLSMYNCYTHECLG